MFLSFPQTQFPYLCSKAQPPFSQPEASGWGNQAFPLSLERVTMETVLAQA